MKESWRQKSPVSAVVLESHAVNLNVDSGDLVQFYNKKVNERKVKGGM